MNLVTFALYPDMPIACEGDDVNARVIQLRVRHDNLRLTVSEQILERRYGGYVQIWNIDEIYHS